MRGACIRLSRMMPVPLRLPHNYTPVFFNTLGTVNPHRHPKAVEPHCHQGRPGESRGPGPVMLAVGRVHTLYMRGQLSATALAAVVGCKRRVRARIKWVRQPHRQSEADPAVVS